MAAFFPSIVAIALQRVAQVCDRCDVVCVECPVASCMGGAFHRSGTMQDLRLSVACVSLHGALCDAIGDMDSDPAKSVGRDENPTWTFREAGMRNRPLRKLARCARKDRALIYHRQIVHRTTRRIKEHEGRRGCGPSCDLDACCPKNKIKQKTNKHHRVFTGAGGAGLTVGLRWQSPSSALSAAL